MVLDGYRSSCFVVHGPFHKLYYLLAYLPSLENFIIFLTTYATFFKLIILLNNKKQIHRVTERQNLQHYHRAFKQ